MENAAILTLAGACVGIALTGLLSVILRDGDQRERLTIGCVYLSFIGMIALPIIKTFASNTLIYYMPLLLVLLLTLPPALYHHILAKTGAAPTLLPWRDLVLPLSASLVCIGYSMLPAQDKRLMFISGELPPGYLPAALALLTFALIVIWLIASFVYLVAILRRLTRYRAELRDLYSDAEQRDQHWVDLIMVLLILVWVAGAFSLADENFANGTHLLEELFLLLIAVGLLVLNIFAPIAPLNPTDKEIEEEPDLKYARSALTSEHAAKLADRLETAMQKDALYLDPSLSLQKLSQQIGALPNQVSQTLNQEIGATFFDYVSRWRVEASKPLITSGDASVLDVALEVGFNSRSTFYKAFKRETGMTPKGYRTLKGTAVQ